MHRCLNASTSVAMPIPHATCAITRGSWAEAGSVATAHKLIIKNRIVFTQGQYPGFIAQFFKKEFRGMPPADALAGVLGPPPMCLAHS